MIHMNADEVKFTMQYRKIEVEQREKGIKFFVCIGDKPHTKEFKSALKDRRA